MAHITVKQLIEALKDADPNAVVCFPIRQSNKVYPVVRLNFESTIDRMSYQAGISKMVTGRVDITLHLPDNHFVTVRKEKNIL